MSTVEAKGCVSAMTRSTMALGAPVVTPESVCLASLASLARLPSVLVATTIPSGSARMTPDVPDDPAGSGTNLPPHILATATFLAGVATLLSLWTIVRRSPKPAPHAQFSPSCPSDDRCCSSRTTGRSPFNASLFASSSCEQQLRVPLCLLVARWSWRGS